VIFIVTFYFATVMTEAGGNVLRDMRVPPTTTSTTCAFESPLLLSFISRFRFYYIIITVLFSFLSHNVFVMSCGILHTIYMYIIRYKTL